MTMSIATNVNSLNAQRNLANSAVGLGTAMQRLSSGFRINSAKDDAAGLAISDRMTAQITGLNQAVRNANDGISLAQTAEGALQESTNIVQRMRELAVQSANDTNTAGDRGKITKEMNQLKSELTRIADTTTFNGKKLLDGSFTSQKFQIGANASQTISVSVNSARADGLGTNRVDLGSGTGTKLALATTGAAVTTNGVLTGNLVLSGTYNGTVYSSTNTVTAGDSAKTIAATVNANTSTTGVTATAITEAKLSTLTAAGTVGFKLTGDTSGSTVTISADITATDFSALATAINDQVSQTGITATLAGDKSSITLTQSSGYDIKFTNFTHSTATKGLSVAGIKADGTASTASTLTEGTNVNGVVGGRIALDSDVTFSASDSVANNLTGATAGTLTASTLTKVSAIDLSTQNGANSAMTVLDGALSMIDSARAELGAVQNRFQSTISNLMNVSENTVAARSRIRDADFASETSAMTKGNILQQAGIAILSQANSNSQNILSLLR